jgi:hypothetical protein
MRNRLLSILVLLGLLAAAGCSYEEDYFVGEINKPMRLFSVEDTSITYDAVEIPANAKILITRASEVFCWVVYKEFHGYLYHPVFLNYHSFDNSIDGNLYGYTAPKRRYFFGLFSGSTGGESENGSIEVKGYHRKDGTYVRPHTRNSHKK